MEKKTWKIRAMQIAMALLCLVMLSMPLYVGLQKLALKHPSWNRGLIAAILCDAPKKNPVPEIKKEKVDWEKEYPFAEKESVSKKVKSRSTPAERLTDGMGKRLIAYYHVVEAGRKIEDIAGWKIMNPATKVVSYGDGYFNFAYQKLDMSSRAKALARLNAFAQSQGARFFYVQAPIKASPTEDLMSLHIRDHANENGDQLLAMLKADGIDYLDLRPVLGEGKTPQEYHQMFFRTDHHWLPQTAVHAAYIVGQKLARDCGIEVDLSQLSLAKYDIEMKDGLFLGSSGKKVTLARTKPDDFPILHPKESTHFFMNWYGRCENLEGAFEITYNLRQIGIKDWYNMNSHSMYGHGDQPLISFENRNLNHFKNQKVMLIKDSFSDTLGPFLTMGMKHLIMVDVREFTGSIETLIKKEKPDVVMVMYSPRYMGEIDWTKHRDQFDFR